MVDQNQAGSSASKLKVKLKIPKTIAINQEQIPTQQIESSNTKNHVCKECKRSFSSGKALGGHMSSAHVQAQANKDLSLKKLKSKKKSNGGFDNIRCKICKRDFHSRKSLFGHMKSHPDRHWRGMDPPEQKSEDSFDYDEFSYSDEDEEEFEEDNQVKSGPVTDLSVSLTGWGVTGKRGRQEPSSEPDEDQNELHAAVHQLIRLLNNPVSKKVEEREVIRENRDFGLGPDEMVVCENDVSMEKSMSISECDRVEIGSEAKRAKVDECINGSDEKPRSLTIKEKESDSSVCPTPISTPGMFFTCNSCGKGFSSCQALGRHRSSHNKPRDSISNSIDEVDTNKCGSSSKPKTARCYAKLFGSGKGVPNGQVLGGHKKCQGTNLVDMVPSNDQPITENGSTQTNVVDIVSYNDQVTFQNGSTQGSSVDMVPYVSQATFENGSTQCNTVDRASSSEQATSADGRTQAPKCKLLLNLNEFPDDDEI